MNTTYSAGDSNRLTREYFDSLLLETRYLDSELPSTKLSLYGERFDTPIMTAALSHLHNICEDGMVEFALGAKNANAVHWVGMGEDEELAHITNTGAKTIKIIKLSTRTTILLFCLAFFVFFISSIIFLSASFSLFS